MQTRCSCFTGHCRMFSPGLQEFHSILDMPRIGRDLGAFIPCFGDRTWPSSTRMSVKVSSSDLTSDFDPNQPAVLPALIAK